MAKRKDINDNKDDTTAAPPLKPATKRLGRVRGGGKTAKQLGIEIQGAEGLDYGDSPIPPPTPPQHGFEKDKTPPHFQGKTIFPAPDAFTMGWDKFRRYLRVLYDNPLYRPRTRVHVYRIWPVLLEGKRKVARMDGVLDDEVSNISIPLKVLDVQDVLHMWGSGSYHLKIHDIGAANKNVCMCNLERAELRNTDYPPILNFEDLDPDDPLNATFLRSINNRRQAGEDISEDKMAGELVKMAEMAINATKEGGSDPAGKAAMDMMTHAARTSMDLVAETARRPDPPPSAQLDPMALVTSVLSVVKEISGGGGNDKYMEALRLAQESERAMFKSQIDFMTTQMKEMREVMGAQLTAATAQQNTPPLKPEGAGKSSMVGQMRELVEMKDLARELVGRGGGGGNSWADLAPVAVQAAGPLIQGLSLWLTSQATGGPVAAPPAGQPANQPQQQQTTTPGISPEIAGAMEQLRGPMLRIFSDPNRNGADFADFFVDLAGEDAYRQLTGIGPDQLQALLMSYPPLAQELTGKEEKLREFIFEFMDAFNQPPDEQQPEATPETEPEVEPTSSPPPMMPPTGMGFGSYGWPPAPVETQEAALEVLEPVEVIDPPTSIDPVEANLPAAVEEGEVEEPPAEPAKKRRRTTKAS